MELDARLALVASTWTPVQQLHAGNVAWHGCGGDGAAAADVSLDGAGWFADVWHDGASGGSEVSGHFSPDLTDQDRRSALGEVRRVAPAGCLSLVIESRMADTLRAAGAAHEPSGPHFLLQIRALHDLDPPALPAGYRLVTAADAGAAARVEAHRRAWAPARITRLLGLDVSGEEPASRFSLDTYAALTGVSIYRPELDLVVLAPDGSPAAYALGWLDPHSRSVLFEPVGTAPEHDRRGLARAVCLAVMEAARELGASLAAVGPRGDGAYPVPRRLYESIGFTTVTRTGTFSWRP